MTYLFIFNLSIIYRDLKWETYNSSEDRKVENKIHTLSYSLTLHLIVKRHLSEDLSD